MEVVGKEEIITSYQRPVLGEIISGIIGERIPCPLFPCPPLVNSILLSSRDPIDVVFFSKLGEITHLSVSKHKLTTYLLQIVLGVENKWVSLANLNNINNLLTKKLTSINGGRRNR
jgi:hypothetical protein